MARADPVTQAERALLGALLSDPDRQAQLLDVVHRDDMKVPYHGQVLAAMQRMRAQRVLPDPLAVYEEIKKDPDLPRGVSHDGVLITDLMEASPRSEHAPAYAAIVIATGIRRRIELAASRITQAAEATDIDGAREMLARARQEISRGQARWEALPAPMRRDLPVRDRSRAGRAEMARRLEAVRDEIRDLREEAWGQPQHRIEDRLASIAQQIADIATATAELRERHDRTGKAAEVRPKGAEAEAAGARLLKELAADPAQISSVRAWLKPGHFARPEQGEVYMLMRDLAASGVPVDPVTVSWEASRRGIRPEAAELAGGMGPLAVEAAREVQRQGFLAQVAKTGRDLRASAKDPELATPSLLRDADDRLSRIEREPWPGDWQPAIPAGREPDLGPGVASTALNQMRGHPTPGASLGRRFSAHRDATAEQVAEAAP